ncbi:unnamed protein product [Linum tenue]|uniref:Uncharacterized protein n=1 Tax=Linum tenue TaxID=586396 RepID=A0AAV0PR35_9ROSI|nr:unnamed protein product [Linum tenue]
MTPDPHNSQPTGIKQTKGRRKGGTVNLSTKRDEHTNMEQTPNSKPPLEAPQAAIFGSNEQGQTDLRTRKTLWIKPLGERQQGSGKSQQGQEKGSRTNKKEKKQERKQVGPPPDTQGNRRQP